MSKHNLSFVDLPLATIIFASRQSDSKLYDTKGINESLFKIYCAITRYLEGVSSKKITELQK
jgi:hypothetical protein